MYVSKVFIFPSILCAIWSCDPHVTCANVLFFFYLLIHFVPSKIYNFNVSQNKQTMFIIQVNTDLFVGVEHFAVTIEHQPLPFLCAMQWEQQKPSAITFPQQIDINSYFIPLRLTYFHLRKSFLLIKKSKRFVA